MSCSDLENCQIVAHPKTCQQFWKKQKLNVRQQVVMADNEERTSLEVATVGRNFQICVDAGDEEKRTLFVNLDELAINSHYFATIKMSRQFSESSNRKLIIRDEPWQNVFDFFATATICVNDFQTAKINEENILNIMKLADRFMMPNILHKSFMFLSDEWRIEEKCLDELLSVVWCLVNYEYAAYEANAELVMRIVIRILEFIRQLMEKPRGDDVNQLLKEIDDDDSCFYLRRILVIIENWSAFFHDNRFRRCSMCEPEDENVDLELCARKVRKFLRKSFDLSPPIQREIGF